MTLRTRSSPNAPGNGVDWDYRDIVLALNPSGGPTTVVGDMMCFDLKQANAATTDGYTFGAKQGPYSVIVPIIATAAGGGSTAGGPTDGGGIYCVCQEAVAANTFTKVLLLGHTVLKCAAAINKGQWLCTNGAANSAIVQGAAIATRIVALAEVTNAGAGVNQVFFFGSALPTINVTS